MTFMEDEIKSGNRDSVLGLNPTKMLKKGSLRSENDDDGRVETSIFGVIKGKEITDELIS